jgi:type VI secretion system protein ImpJ
MSTSIQKVLWGEGLFIRPQHFQQQDAFHQWRLQQAMRFMHPYACGIHKLEIDHTALQSGQLRVLALELVFPNGEFYSAPTEDDLPEPRDVASAVDLAPNGQATFAAVCAPLRDGAATSCAPSLKEAGVSVPYHRFERAVYDQFTNAPVGSVTSLKRAVHLMGSSEPDNHLTSMPLVLVRRNSLGAFEFDPAYMPPCLNIRASSAMHRLLENFLVLLRSKVQALSSKHGELSKNIVEFRSGDTASFWLLHTARHAYGSLLHLSRNPGLHPERLFECLLQLVCSLGTFSKESELGTLPQYEHLQPGHGFAQLETLIRDLLETVIPTRHFGLALRDMGHGIYHADLNNPKITPTTHLYLGVKASLSAAQIALMVPKLFKIGSPDDVQNCITGATSGVPLMHMAQVPTEINLRSGLQYFALQAQGPSSEMFERMRQAQTLALYCATHEFKDVSLELIALNP